MEILYPQGELYRVNLFFELYKDKVSKGMPKVLYLRSKSVPNEAGNVTRVITLTEVSLTSFDTLALSFTVPLNPYNILFQLLK